MQLTPHRAELVLEALQLREFGWTQQQIADALSTPAVEVYRKTVSNWLLKYMANPEMGNMAIRARLGHIVERAAGHIKNPPITLYACKYEELDGQIPSGSIDLILTDPPCVDCGRLG